MLLLHAFPIKHPSLSKQVNRQRNVRMPANRIPSGFIISIPMGVFRHKQRVLTPAGQVTVQQLIQRHRHLALNPQCSQGAGSILWNRSVQRSRSIPYTIVLAPNHLSIKPINERRMELEGVLAPTTIPKITDPPHSYFTFCT